MSGFDNEVMFSTGERLEPSSAQAIGIMQQTANDVSRINYNATPEGAVAANPSSLCHDRVAGNLYLKQTGTGNTGWIKIVAAASVGQTITGNTGGALSPTAGNWNIVGTGSISTSGSGSTLTISSTVSPVVWTDEATSFNAAVGNGYFATAAVTATLPASPSQGNTIYLFADSASALTIQANTGQKIRLGNVISASAGTAVSTKQGDSLTLVYRSASTTWDAISSTGSWNVT